MPGDATARRADAIVTRWGSGAGSSVFAWSIFLVLFGLYMAPIVVVIGGDHGVYCDSIDHPSTCPNLLPGFAYALVALGGGSWSLATSVRYRRGRPNTRRWLVVALPTTAATLLALGVWAAIEDRGTRLSAPGRLFLLVAVVNAAVCALLVSLVKRSPSPTPR